MISSLDCEDTPYSINKILRFLAIKMHFCSFLGAFTSFSHKLSYLIDPNRRKNHVKCLGKLFYTANFCEPTILVTKNIETL